MRTYRYGKIIHKQQKLINCTINNVRMFTLRMLKFDEYKIKSILLKILHLINKNPIQIIYYIYFIFYYIYITSVSSKSMDIYFQ